MKEQLLITKINDIVLQVSYHGFATQVLEHCTPSLNIRCVTTLDANIWSSQVSFFLEKIQIHGKCSRQSSTHHWSIFRNWRGVYEYCIHSKPFTYLYKQCGKGGGVSTLTLPLLRVFFMQFSCLIFLF